MVYLRDEKLMENRAIYNANGLVQWNAGSEALQVRGTEIFKCNWRDSDVISRLVILGPLSLPAWIIYDSIDLPIRGDDNRFSFFKTLTHSVMVPWTRDNGRQRYEVMAV